MAFTRETHHLGVILVAKWKMAAGRVILEPGKPGKGGGFKPVQLPWA